MENTNIIDNDNQTNAENQFHRDMAVNTIIFIVCYELLVLFEGSSVCMCVRHGVHGQMLWCGVILTGPTQLRIITACLHRDANESGSATSATMISTSELSSGLPVCEYRQACMGKQVKTHTKIIITERQLSGGVSIGTTGGLNSFVMFPQLITAKA